MSKHKIRPERIDISARYETSVTRHHMSKARNFDLRGEAKGHGLRDPDMGQEVTYKDIDRRY